MSKRLSLQVWEYNGIRDTNCHEPLGSCSCRGKGFGWIFSGVCVACS